MLKSSSHCNTSEGVMSCCGQQVECLLNALARHRHTLRQMASKACAAKSPGARGTGACVGGFSESALCLKPTSACSTGLFTSACILPPLLLNPFSTDPASLGCIPYSDFYLLSRPAASNFLLLAARFLSIWIWSSLGRLLISIFFRPSLFLRLCTSGCWIKPKHRHWLTPPPKLIEKLTVGILFKKEGAPLVLRETIQIVLW